MSDKEIKDIAQRATDAMIDKPVVFSVNGKYLYLNHATLGKMRLIERLFAKIQFNEQALKENPFLEYLRITSQHRDVVLRIIAYHTIRDKGGVLNEGFVRTRIEYLDKNLDDADLASVFMASNAMDEVPAFMKALGISKDNERRDIVAQVKSDSHSILTFGSVSDYGRLLYRGCELFHDYDYVMWGISYVNLVLLLNDAPTTVTLTDEEQKRLPRSMFRNMKSDIINASDPRSWAKLKGRRIK